MSDISDRADEQSAPLQEAAIQQQHLKAVADAKLPFIAGDCDLCGETFARLVECDHPREGDVWSCARCRDKHKIQPVKRRPT